MTSPEQEAEVEKAELTTEFDALRIIYEALEPFDHSDRHRMIAFIMNRLSFTKSPTHP